MVACPSQAAEHFGVSAASAIRWRGRLKEAGDIVPKRQGGDRRSQRIETYSQFILDAVTVKPDMTLAELRDLLKRRGYRRRRFALAFLPAQKDHT